MIRAEFSHADRVLSIRSSSLELPLTARTLQGMARVRSGQAPAWALSC